MAMVGSDQRYQPPPISLCENMMLEILSRLPLPDLRLCKSVSKDWHRRLVPYALSLLPINLAFLHLNSAGVPRIFSISDHSCVRYHGEHPSSSFYTISLERYRLAKFLAVCNGMAVACTEAQPSQGIHRPSSFTKLRELKLNLLYIVNYVVYNPLSDQTSTIHPPPRSRSNGFNFLVFDPASRLTDL